MKTVIMELSLSNDAYYIWRAPPGGEIILNPDNGSRLVGFEVYPVITLGPVPEKQTFREISIWRNDDGTIGWSRDIFADIVKLPILPQDDPLQSAKVNYDYYITITGS